MALVHAEEFRPVMKEKRIPAVVIGLLESRQTDAVLEKCLQIMECVSREGKLYCDESKGVTSRTWTEE